MLNATLLMHMGDDLMVANAARVSMHKHHDAFVEPDDTRLIHYLARHAHWTPFAHPQAQFRIEAPIFIARQWFRHTIGTVRNEVSRRYVSDEPEMFYPSAWRQRPTGSIKQGSGETFDDDTSREIDQTVARAYTAAQDAYFELLDRGVAPEQARMVLPQGTVTTWIETGSLYFWARLCTLRVQPDAQAEIRELAEQIDRELTALFPVSWFALRQATT